MTIRWFGAALLLLSFALLAGCGKPAAQPRRGARVERLPRLEVVQPERKRLVRRLEVSAIVEALQKVDLSARVPGVVKDFPPRIDIGYEVKKGEVLCQLAVPELEVDRSYKEALLDQAKKLEVVAAAALVVARREVEESEVEDKRFEADVQFNRLKLTRIRELVRQRAQDPAVEQETQRQYESALAALASNKVRTVKRQAKVEAAIADVDLARQKTVAAELDIKKVKELIGFATVTAPFDGVITRRWIDPGAIIKDSGATLLTVVQMNRVRVLLDVPQRDVPYLNARDQNPNADGKGDVVLIRLPSLAEIYPRGEVTGTITRVGRSLDPVTRTMRAEVEVENPGLHLRPGMYGSASILVEDRSNVLTLPASALVRRGEGLVEVYQVANPVGEGDERRGVLKRLPVVLGIDDGKEVEVRQGLRGDELIVLRSSGVMRPDELVLAVTERESPGER